TGTYVHPAASQEAMQAYVNGEAGKNGNAWFESAKASSGNVHGYDNASFPEVADPDAYRTVTYYDGYGLKSLIAEGNYDYVAGEAGKCGNAWFESAKACSGNVHGYDNASFPKVADPDAYRTVTYYDGYGFKSLIAEGNYDYVAGELPGQEASWNTRVKGLVTG